MIDIIELPMESDGGHLVDPPIVDSLHRDEIHNEWVLSFIPDESVSTREKEQVVIASESSDGRRIGIRVENIERLLHLPVNSVDQVFHCGDGNFAFHTVEGAYLELADPHVDTGLSLRVYDELKDIAITAQIAYASSHVA